MIKQKTIIEISSPKPLEEMGNHVLFYDKSKKCYVAMTLEDFLAPMDRKIAQLETKVDRMEKLFGDTKDSLQGAYNEFTANISKEKQEFLATYKETNATIIKMVKSFINGEGD